MKKIEFITLLMAVAHAKNYGGWIFHNEKENVSVWYDATHYTLSKILTDSKGSGQIRTWSYFEKELQTV